MDAEKPVPRGRRPIPPLPPPPLILPPTEPDGWQDPPELVRCRECFRRGDYRGCVEPLEALYFARRNTFHQGLIQYVVALLQLRLGLVRTPRGLLRQALDLWAPYPDWQEGIRLNEVRGHARTLLERLPEGVHSVPAEEVDRWWVDPPEL